jgi:hypothetical protein
VSTSDSVRGWSYKVGRGLCSLCGEEDSVLSSAGEGAVCEHCALAAGMAWRRVAGEVPLGFPDEDVRRSSSVQVIVARRRMVADPKGVGPRVPGPREITSAYEFLMVPVGGAHALPSAPTPPGTTVAEGAGRALESVGLRTWPALCETLHVGYTPRGRLATFVLVRGYATSSVTRDDEHPERGEGTWLPWPASAHAGKLAGLYEFLESAWTLRLYRLCVPGDRLPSEVSVRMREVARRYVELQSASAAGGGVDASMLSAYRAAMTADELAVAELVSKFEEEERRKVSRKRLSAVPAAEVKAEVEVEGGGGGVGGLGGDDDGDDTGAGDLDSGDEDDGAGGGDPPPEPGFARSFPRR